ncbi:sodium:solute symporter family transporter [Croceivirga sp. JEA036]|uniref:sodium:solute symporter family transporter n=1 Tax=Croceivirga sp. JEA036 TaxID=2721162 RepID=UPI00143BABE3|nr:sodium transporter [Croceivirga sp. JEA036]NJB37770.1 sodium transporter [Croceivirga sp. JEA036]
MTTLDYVVIFVFTFLVVLAGISFGKSGKDMKSYFAAGGAVPWSISGLSLYMSFFSAGTFVVWGSIAYKMGWVAITIQSLMCLGGFLVAYFIAPKWRKTNVLTAAEFVRRRLGERTQKLYTIIILILSLAYTGAFLYPVAKIVSVSTNCPINACIIGLGLLVLLYTVVGGLWAVIITDVLQFVILTVVVAIVVILALNNVGGISGFIAKAPEDFWSLTGGEYSWKFMLAFAVYNTVFIGGNWAYVQRYTSVKTPKDAKKVGLTFGWLYLVSPLVWMLPPMIYRIINPNLEGGLGAEEAYMLMCKEVLPMGMLGLMLGGMVFATASSVNTTLNLAASIITNDVFKPWKPNASDKQLMSVAKISTLLFGLGTIAVALLVPSLGGIVNVVLSVGAVTGCSLYGPPIWALFSKRITGRAVLAITLISLALNILVLLISPLNRANEMLLGAVLPFLLLGLYEGYLVQKGKKTSLEYKKYQLLQEKNTLVTESNSGQNEFGLKILGNTLAAVGFLIVVLAFFGNNSAVLIACMGVLILVVAALIHPSVKIISKA